jgi:transcriptional regulator with XRE-family HTH domain
MALQPNLQCLKSLHRRWRARRSYIEVPERAHLAPKPCLHSKMFPLGYIFLTFNDLQQRYSRLENRVPNVNNDQSTVDRRALEIALVFGSIIRKRRKALNMRQDQLALATGVGRRFLIELEAGKPSCQLGRSLLVAEALGLRPADVLPSGGVSESATALELPDLSEELEEPDGRSARIL